jgi:hypothetical protein
VVAAAALAAHGGDVRNGFVWDDEPIVVESPVTRNVSRLGEALLTPDEVKPYYRPLNRASYLLDHRLAGLDPRWFHLVNVLVHAASALALYAVGRRLFARCGPALLAALLLAVHPIHVEAVAFVSARNDLLAVRRPSVASTVGLLWLGLHLLPIVDVVPIPSTVIAERFFHASAAGLWLVVADPAIAAQAAAALTRLGAPAR